MTDTDHRPASAEQRLRELGVALPPPPEPFASCVEAVQVGNRLSLSGMLPTEGHGAKFVGRVGAELDEVVGNEHGGEARMQHPTFYRTAQVDGLSIFYREAGSSDAPTLLLLHGLPASSWKTRRAFWADRAVNESTLRTNLLSLATTRTRHVGNDPNVERYDPDLWTDEFAFLNQPCQADIQSDLFYDYRTNVESYPAWQEWMREKQPRLLVIWGKHDLSFELSEPDAYRRDVPNADVHILDAGHFALDTAADQIAQLVRVFMS